MGTPLGPKYIPYAYMDPLGQLHRDCLWRDLIGSSAYVAPSAAGRAVSLDGPTGSIARWG